MKKKRRSIRYIALEELWIALYHYSVEKSVDHKTETSVTVKVRITELTQGLRSGADLFVEESCG